MNKHVHIFFFPYSCLLFSFTSLSPRTVPILLGARILIIACALTQYVLLRQPLLYKHIVRDAFELFFELPNDSLLQPLEGFDKHVTVHNRHCGTASYGSQAEVHDALWSCAGDPGF